MAGLGTTLRLAATVKAFADHFSTISADYATYRPRYPEGLFTALAGAVSRHDTGLGLRHGDGPGRASSSRDGSTASSPATPVPRRCGKAERREPVTYLAAPAERVPLRSGSADLITVAQALHWIELDQFYAEARRVLAPGGLVAVWTYGRHWVDGGAIDAAGRGISTRTSSGPYWPPERRWVEAGYAGLPFPFQKVPLMIPPMAEEWTLGQMLGYISTWSAVVRYAQVNGANPVAALAERLGPLWEPDRRRRIEWTLTLLAGDSDAARGRCRHPGSGTARARARGGSVPRRARPLAAAARRPRTPAARSRCISPGNLQHYFGACLAGTSYRRDRAAEFAERDVPRAEILRRIEAARAAVRAAAERVDEPMLEGRLPRGHRRRSRDRRANT